MARVLVTRPQPLADETAAALRAAGHEALVAPLMETVAVAWTPPAAPPDALLMTSPQAALLGGDGLRALAGAPLYTVGERTAAAARAAGLSVVHTGAQDGAAALAAAAADGRRMLLHLAGEDRTDLPVPDGLRVDIATLYAARLAPLTEAATDALAAGTIDWVLLFSSRSAAHFSALHDAGGWPRARLGIAALSAKVLAAAGAGWRVGVAAAAPDTAALLAAAGLAGSGPACDKPGERPAR
ncbi:MAG: uroporphyrinogen-III synthase [Alphaproteobacteria bacterium]|nr:uroporphyrinogen-III synthase [Alphaproteobacteria bacterium]